MPIDAASDPYEGPGIHQPLDHADDAAELKDAGLGAVKAGDHVLDDHGSSHVEGRADAALDTHADSKFHDVDLDDAGSGAKGSGFQLDDHAAADHGDHLVDAKVGIDAHLDAAHDGADKHGFDDLGKHGADDLDHDLHGAGHDLHGVHDLHGAHDLHDDVGLKGDLAHDHVDHHGHDDGHLPDDGHVHDDHHLF
jgi:hypothetical protein